MCVVLGLELHPRQASPPSLATRDISVLFILKAETQQRGFWCSSVCRFPSEVCSRISQVSFSFRPRPNKNSKPRRRSRPEVTKLRERKSKGSLSCDCLQIGCILLITEQLGWEEAFPAAQGLNTGCPWRTASILPNSLRPSALPIAKSCRADCFNEAYSFYQADGVI